MRALSSSMKTNDNVLCDQVALESRSTSLDSAVASYYMENGAVFILQEDAHRPRGTAYQEGRKA